jgi:hypothetical protein
MVGFFQHEIKLDISAYLSVLVTVNSSLLYKINLLYIYKLLHKLHSKNSLT